MSFVHRALLALPLVLLAACGGGGGSTSSQPNTCFRVHDGGCLTEAELEERAQQETEIIKQINHRRIDAVWGEEAANAVKWPAAQINAYRAEANLRLTHGLTDALGEEVTIGFIDTGIHEDHEAFDYVSVTEEFLAGAVDEDLDERSHGTSVASIAVGNDINMLFSGYGNTNINVKMFAIPLGDGSGPYTPINLNQLAAANFGDATLFRYVIDQDLDILNLSFGYSGGIENYSEQDLRRNYGRTIAALAQTGRQEKTILVYAAGNAGREARIHSLSPEIGAGLVAYMDELQGHSIAVVSTRENGEISNFSNRCGIAADFCIAAPGEGVLTATRTIVAGDRYGITQGTSFAAPMVSGGLIAMKKLFRDQLTNEELVDRLFATAKKTGIHGNQAIYGQGLMDLGAATNPWGIPAFMGTAGATPISSTSLTLGAPFGDGLANALASREVVAFDSLGAPFWFEAASFTGLSEGASLATRLNDFLHPAQLRSIPETWQFNLKENATATEIGHLALANGASRLAIAGPQGVSAMLFQDPQELEGLTLAWTPRTFDAFTVEAGYLNEHQSLLGSHGEGAGGRFSGETLFLGAGLNVMAGNWQLAAQGEVGHVTPAVAHSQFIKEISSLSTSSFRLAASRPFANGSALHFSLSQPLRVESGSFTHNLVASGAHALSLDQAVSDPLAPQGRQLDLTARLDLPWLGGDLSLGATRSAQPRHQQSAAPEWTLFTGYRSTW
ncbi:MAG: S8 family serine peptidase [Cyanobacteria bacterium MAG CAR1_bin_15]|nr:S8 family serine peptidase [Cyanobacteria bacterium MAG CAR1_bin_15]